jgi:hypothetical protein
MTADITSKERELVESFLNPKDTLDVFGQVRRTITRADGSIEEVLIKNTPIAAGLNHLAQLGVGDVTSWFAYIAIGTQTAAASLGSVITAIGEVGRKIGATLAASNEFMIIAATWAGNADSLTSVDLRTGAFCAHPNSGQAPVLSMVPSLATILAASDFLKVQMEVRVGSHNL